MYLLDFAEFSKPLGMTIMLLEDTLTPYIVISSNK